MKFFKEKDTGNFLKEKDTGNFFKEKDTGIFLKEKDTSPMQLWRIFPWKITIF